MGELKIGLQLYSIRDKMEEDLENALKTVKEIGYDYVEMAGYFGKSAEDLADLLDKYGLQCVSVHQGLDFYLEKGQAAIDFVKTLGAKYSAIPWYEKDVLKNNLDECLDLFKTIGKQLSDNGLQMLYHNHDFEFEKINDTCIIDMIYNRVPAECLNPEFDTCWVKYAGYSPVEYLKKYADRIDVVHLKDFWCEKLGDGPVYALIDNDGNEIKTEQSAKRNFEFRPIGSGINEIADILKTAEQVGASYVIVEQDDWYDDDSMALAKKSREYLKSIGY